MAGGGSCRTSVANLKIFKSFLIAGGSKKRVLRKSKQHPPHRNRKICPNSSIWIRTPSGQQPIIKGCGRAGPPNDLLSGGPLWLSFLALRAGKTIILQCPAIGTLRGNRRNRADD
jgi:hypothetical protein